MSTLRVGHVARCIRHSDGKEFSVACACNFIGAVYTIWDGPMDNKDLYLNSTDRFDEQEFYTHYTLAGGLGGLAPVI